MQYKECLRVVAPENTSELPRRRTPAVLFATRHLDVYDNFKMFIKLNIEKLHVDCMNLFAEIEEGCVTIDRDGLVRDDAFVEFLRTFIQGWPVKFDLIIAGIQEGPKTLYRNCVGSIPLGFVPKDVDHAQLCRAIAELLEKGPHGVEANHERE